MCPCPALLSTLGGFVQRSAAWLLLLPLAFGLAPAVVAQTAPFDLEAYQRFLDTHADLSTEALYRMHPAGVFAREAGVPFHTARYSDSLRIKYDLTAYEEELLDRHGFAVTERLAFDSFGNALQDIFVKDLPLFLSTDAILHALHMSYSEILQRTERAVLVPQLEALLASLHEALPTLADRYAGVAGVEQPLRDLDVYLTVPRRLLTETTVPPLYPENEAEVETLLGLVGAEQGMVTYALFAENCRIIDFSQFKPRGHYAQSEDLTRYFRAMMWLGRIELYLQAPATDECRPSDADVQRQTLAALLLMEAAEAGAAEAQLADIESLLHLFVGEPDNVTLSHLQALRTQFGFGPVTDLLAADQLAAFQDTLAAQAGSLQRIQSQILLSGNPTEPGRLRPAISFLLFGQRFVIDAYVTGSVVFDKIAYEGQAVRRMLPDPLDVLFALGNDAAAQLLAPELEQYPYASNLAALRYLVDSYEDPFWQQTLYNGWLHAIRTLNPPAEADRAALPPFMQTAAWWQEKMNTQLAAWAQLRHDNLLYAKQSYSGGATCMFPYTYVEPIPAFYEAVSAFARTASARFAGVEHHDGFPVSSIHHYFDNLALTNDTLATIAYKELDGTPFDDAERGFLQRVLFMVNACGLDLDGWYPRLFYGDPGRVKEPDLVVADVHTAPTDAGGYPVGWVLHVGTGLVDMALVTAAVPGEGTIAFVGPVLSYYEHLSTGFERLTDEVWETAYAAAFRPDFVNLYLADKDGASRGNGASLAVGIERIPETDLPDPAETLLRNYPNPFRDMTRIVFTIPAAYAHRPVVVEVYDAQGRRVGGIVDERLPAGHYNLRWNGRLAGGTRAASGIYFCRLRVGDHQETTPMIFVR